MKNNQYVTINTNNGSEKMHIDHYSRWLCLIEAVEFIGAKCEEWGKDMDDVDWVKPIALQKYIDERFHSMKHDVKCDIELGVVN
jgi:hypothetical protein